MGDNWSVVESENYRFFFHKDTEAEKRIEEIKKYQEGCFKTISKVLNVDFDKKIEYYLCESPEEVGILYGDNEPCNGFARKPNEIYAVFNKEIECIGYHEDAHIISYSIAVPPQTFMREGLAMHFDKVWWGIDNLAWVNYYINNEKYISIYELMKNEEFYKHDCSITYPIAGAFTEYIIYLYGIERYKKLYRNLSEDFLESFNKSFGIELRDLEEDFIDYVKSHKINNKLLEVIKNMLNE